MKKMYCCLICFFLSIICFNFCYCQVSFGVKSGINIATVKDINSDPKNRIGWYGGASVFILLNEKIFFQPELLFSVKGYKYIGGLYDTKKSAVRLNYLTAPVLLGFKIDHKTSIYIGPEVGYLLSAFYKFPYERQAVNGSDGFPVKWDVEIDVGLRYLIRQKFGMEIRYTYGFKNMYLVDAVGVRIGEVLAGNRVFQIGVLYSFTSTK